MRQGKVWRIIAYVILIPLVCLAVYPILFLVTGSLKSSGELSQNLGPILNNSEGFVGWSLLPLSPTLRSYVELLLDSPSFFVMFWNSIKIVVLVLMGQLLLGVPAAWGFAHFDFKGKNILFMVYVMLMFLPFQVLMLPEYLTIKVFNLMNTHWAIILPGIFSTFPVFIMYHFFIQIPKSIIESGKLDGAGEFQILIRIGLPLGSSGIISAVVLSFLEYWNLIEQPLTFLKDQSLWPMSLYLPNIALESAGGAFVAAVITLIPSILVFLLGQDYLEQGIAATGAKE